MKFYIYYMDMFYALMEPKRRTIIELLAQTNELSMSEIAEHFKVSTAAISQHLKVLRTCGLVFVTKRAKQRIYHLNPNALHELESWAQQLAQNYEALEQLLIAPEE